MHSTPTLKSFLLRSRVLWMTIFSLMFFSWAWWDAERYRTTIDFLLGSSFEFALWTGDGGFSVSLGEIVPDRPANRLIFERHLKYPISGRRILIHYWPPQIHFSSLLLLSLFLSTLWHTWRWRVIRKHTQEDNLTNR
jgi:hypothetical protein